MGLLRCKRVVISAAIAILAAAPAWAATDPGFTPVHVAKQSSLILELKIAKPADHKATATVVRKLKGEGNLKTVELMLSTCAVKEQIETVEKLLADGKNQVFPGIPQVFQGQYIVFSDVKLAACVHLAAPSPRGQAETIYCPRISPWLKYRSKAHGGPDISGPFRK